MVRTRVGGRGRDGSDHYKRFQFTLSLHRLVVRHRMGDSLLISAKSSKYYVKLMIVFLR